MESVGNSEKLLVIGINLTNNATNWIWIEENLEYDTEYSHSWNKSCKVNTKKNREIIKDFSQK